jgi:hypothetical protein
MVEYMQAVLAMTAILPPRRGERFQAKRIILTNSCLAPGQDCQMPSPCAGTPSVGRIRPLRTISFKCVFTRGSSRHHSLSSQAASGFE